MSTSESNGESNTGEMSQEELLAENRRLRGQVAAAADPGHDPGEQERPWTVAAENVSEEHTRSVAPLPYRGPGAVLHHWPHLTGGSGGPQDGPYVRALAELLAELGFDTNDVIAGRVNYFENTLAGDVARFKREHDVREHVAAYQGHQDPAEDVARRLVGPYTIQAVLEKVAEKRGQDVPSLIGQVEYDIGRAQARR